MFLFLALVAFSQALPCNGTHRAVECDGNFPPANDKELTPLTRVKRAKTKKTADEGSGDTAASSKAGKKSSGGKSAKSGGGKKNKTAKEWEHYIKRTII